MILDKEIEIKISNNQIKYYKNKGYDVKGGNELKKIKVSDLSKNSGQKIKVKCDICDKEKIISLNRYNINTKNNTTYYSCSRKCSEEKNKITLLKKYGVDNISKLEEVKDEKIKKSLENNGVKYPMQNKEIFKKGIFTKLKKYGDINYNNQKKRKETSLQIYGFDIPTKSEIVKNKIRISNSTNYTDLISSFNNNNYEYESNNNTYENTHDYIKIICNKHGEFKQKAYKHKSGQGCPKCNQSKGEKQIEDILIFNNMKYENQKRFKECKNINTLPFDFYLPDLKVCIEYDGIQHFKILDFFGGKKEFIKRIKNDDIKNMFCIFNNIKLIRIAYFEDISTKLSELF